MIQDITKGTEQIKSDVLSECVNDRRALLTMLKGVKDYLPLEHRNILSGMDSDQPVLEKYLNDTLGNETSVSIDQMKEDAERFAMTLKDK